MKTSSKQSKDQAKFIRQEWPEMTLSFQVGAVLLISLFLAFTYFVFIPQLSALTSLEENQCEYIKHHVESVGDQSKSFNYSIDVIYEHAHAEHHHEHVHGERLVGEKHRHQGVIKSTSTFPSKEEANLAVDPLQEKKQFTCYVDVIRPVDHILVERPPSTQLIGSSIVIFGLGACAIYLLKIYVSRMSKSAKRELKKDQ
jgi:hypothetical protein